MGDTIQGLVTGDTLNVTAILGNPYGIPATAGQIGEVIAVTGGVTALTTTVNANTAQITVTPGDWDVWGVCPFTPAGTTNGFAVEFGLSTVSATLPPIGQTISTAGTLPAVGLPANGAISLGHPPITVTVSVATNLFLVCNAIFTAGTVQATNPTLTARRRR